MSERSKNFDIAGYIAKGSRVKKLEIEAPEDPDEKGLRLQKEKWTFLVKDLGAYVASFVFVIFISIYCFSVVIRYGVSSNEAKVVWPIITSLFGGVVGIAFGRSMK